MKMKNKESFRLFRVWMTKYRRKTYKQFQEMVKKDKVSTSDKESWLYFRIGMHEGRKFAHKNK